MIDHLLSSCRSRLLFEGHRQSWMICSFLIDRIVVPVIDMCGKRRSGWRLQCGSSADIYLLDIFTVLS